MICASAAFDLRTVSNDCADQLFKHPAMQHQASNVFILDMRQRKGAEARLQRDTSIEPRGLDPQLL